MEKLVFPRPVLPTLPVSGGDHRFPVRRIYCVGRNYLEHIREMGADERDPPFFFQKPTDSIVQDGGVVPYPPITEDLQFEAELVLAIGEDGADISVADAARHIFGFTAGIDMTRRDLQVAARKSGRPWEIGKSFDHSAPCGTLVPCAGTPLPLSGEIELTVNGDTKQRADLDQMIWNSYEVVSQLSRQYHLAAGDLIFTGTPAGVGSVKRGDVVQARVTSICELRIHIR